MEVVDRCVTARGVILSVAHFFIVIGGKNGIKC